MLLGTGSVEWLRSFVAHRKKNAEHDFEQANSEGWAAWKLYIAHNVEYPDCCDQTCQHPEQRVAINGSKGRIVGPNGYRCYGKDISGLALKKQPGYEQATTHRNGTFQCDSAELIALGGRRSFEKLTRNQMGERKDEHATKKEEPKR